MYVLLSLSLSLYIYTQKRPYTCIRIYYYVHTPTLDLDPRFPSLPPAFVIRLCSLFSSGLWSRDKSWARPPLSHVLERQHPRLHEELWKASPHTWPAHIGSRRRLRRTPDAGSRVLGYTGRSFRPWLCKIPQNDPRGGIPFFPSPRFWRGAGRSSPEPPWRGRAPDRTLRGSSGWKLALDSRI